MAIAKIIEVEAEGDSIEAAVENAVSGASDTVRNVQSAYVREFEAVVEGGSVSHYRADVKVTFLLDGGDAS